MATVPWWMAQQAGEQADLTSYLDEAGYPLGPIKAPKSPVPGGPLGLNGTGVDHAALAVLRSLQNAPRPRGFAQNALAGFAQGAAGARASQARQRADTDAKAASEAGDMDKERRKAAASYLATYRQDQRRAAAKAAETAAHPQVASTPKQNEAYIHLDTPEKVAAFEKQYPHMAGKVPPDGIVQRSSIFPKNSGAGGRAAIDIGFDPDVIADKIHDGIFPPTGANLSRGQWGKVATSIATKYPKMNLSRAQNAWTATTVAIRSMNGRQQLQLHNSAAAVQEVLPQISALIEELDSLTPKGDATPINKIIVGGAQHWGMNGRRAQAIAQDLLTKFQGVGGELANIYSAGGVPSDKALAMSERVLNMALPAHALKAGLDAESGLINVRINAISSFNPMVPGGEAKDYKLSGEPPPAPIRTPALVDTSSGRPQKSGFARGILDSVKRARGR